MKRLTILLCMILLSNLVRGQALHFSQYSEFNSAFNPSAVGLVPDQDYEGSVVYRNQWSSLPAPFNTFGANASFSLYLGDRFQNGWFGLGFYALNDVAGDGDLTNTKLQGSMAYHQKIGFQHMLSAGIAVGNNSLSLKPEALTYASQWNGGEFDITLPNNERFDAAATSYLYINSGINYSYSDEMKYIRVGYSLLNINQPSASFQGAYKPVGLRQYFSVDAMFKMNPRMIVKPVANFSMISGAKEILIGTGMYYNANNNLKNKNILFGGLNYRIGDAVIPYMGYEEDHWKLIFSYDVTASELSRYNNSNGAFEVGLVIRGDYPGGNSKKEKLICPRF